MLRGVKEHQGNGRNGLLGFHMHPNSRLKDEILSVMLDWTSWHSLESTTQAG